MDRLLDIGFKNIGHWKFDSEKFDYDIKNNLTDRNLLYSFVCENQVFYIGKTTNTLKNRLNGYKNANSTQKTNIRVKKEILSKLKTGKRVEILILLDKANLQYYSYKISLASGLEDILIEHIKPEWNFRGKTRIKEIAITNENENIIIESFPSVEQVIKTVEITLGSEYWNKGFFNFSKKELELLPTESTDVIIFLGQNDDFYINGYFHFPDKNNQPRVRGNKALKEWFQDKYKQGDKMKVDILKPNIFRIK